MIHEIQHLLDEYHKWLKDKTRLSHVGTWVQITTPYLDRHNDYIRLYAIKDNGNYTLTDDGFTVVDLEQIGYKLNSPKRQELLQMILNGFGVKLVDNRLEVNASDINFALRKHHLEQAILAVNVLFFYEQDSEGIQK